MVIPVNRIDLASGVASGTEDYSTDAWPFGEVTIETVVTGISRARHRGVSAVPCTLTLLRSTLSRSGGTSFLFRMHPDWREQLPERLYPGSLDDVWRPMGTFASGVRQSHLELAGHLHAVAEIDGTPGVVSCGTIGSMTIR